MEHAKVSMPFAFPVCLCVSVGVRNRRPEGSGGSKIGPLRALNRALTGQEGKSKAFRAPEAGRSAPSKLRAINLTDQLDRHARLAPRLALRSAFPSDLARPGGLNWPLERLSRATWRLEKPLDRFSRPWRDLAARMAPRLTPRTSFSSILARFGGSKGSSIDASARPIRNFSLAESDDRLERPFRATSFDLAVRARLSRGSLERLGAIWRRDRPPRAAISSGLARLGGRSSPSTGPRGQLGQLEERSRSGQD